MRYKGYNGKMIEDARLVAIRAHGNQAYDEIFPYEKHLNDVVNVLERFGFGGKYLVGGYLHDTLEDGALSYNKIKRVFGEEIADMVDGVTDRYAKTRKEKKVLTLPITAKNQSSIILKLADRIANIEHGGKIDMYASEYAEFKNYLFGNTPLDGKPMWEHLEKLLKIS